MIDLRPVLLIIGIFVSAFGALMIVPMIVDILNGDPDWQTFGTSSIILLAFGAGLVAACWGKFDTISTRQGFLITTASWVSLGFAASLPLYLSTMDLSYTDAFFEAMSGLTTTGSTIVEGLDEAPMGFLLWRSILQWIGGIGVVIMAIAILPFLSVGGMQLFRLESSDQSDKILPGASQIAAAISGLYVTFTALCFFAYWALGMGAFDAINHAMTTIATGGYSTKDDSFGYFLGQENIRGPIDIVATGFMILGALPFGIYLLALRGRFRAPLNDSQVRFFLAAAALFIVIISARIIALFDFGTFEAFRLAAFNVISIMTGTGYATTDYGLWGPFAIGFFFCIMFVGGCAGSTSCGLKIFRLQVAFAALSEFSKRLAHPHRATVIRYNGRKITDDVYLSVLSFFFIYFTTFATVAVLLSFFQLDPVTALSAAGSAIANVGPGLGETIGPSGNYASLPNGAKWILGGAMLLGRLEFLTVLVLFAPGFWQR